MAKKFGKFLLLTAAVGTAAAAAYYYVRKKDGISSVIQDDDEDYDDFSDDLDDASETASRNYVALNREGQSAAAESNVSAPDKESDTEFTPLAEQIAQTDEEKMEKSVEEFFDEESTDEEPPIQDI